jgi:chromosome segregation ATPase
MTARLVSFSDLDKSNATLFKDKASLLEQVGTLSIKLKEAKDNCVKINKELANLTEKLGKVQKENDNLKIEIAVLGSKQAGLKMMSEEANQAAQNACLLETENAQLKAKISTLQANQDARIVSKDQEALKEKIKDLEVQEIKLKEALEEWTGLAKVYASNRKQVDKS